MSLTRGKDIFMKKILLFASALAGFSVMAQAQEATTIKTTTVSYSVPTCTNCRTTTQTKTTYPEPEPVCTTCAATPVVAQPVAMKRKEKKSILCRDNHDFGIRNPLFTLKEGQLSIQQVDGVFKEPKRKRHRPDASGADERGEYRGYNAYGRVMYGLTDRWSIQVFGGKKYAIPKTSQYRASLRQAYIDQGLEPPEKPGPVPHQSGYNVNIGTYYHIVDLCHLDVIVGVEGMWHREKTKLGDKITRINGLAWQPTITVGSNWGWFTPYVNAAYKWDHTKAIKDASGNKKWVKTDGYMVNPGIYIQPSKYYAFDFNIEKPEDVTAHWNAGVDFYPYKNIALGLQFNSRRPFRDPMYMYGLSGVAKVVF